MALAQPSRREKYFIHNDLVCLVKGLENNHITVDLRNESCVYGKLEQVDGFMNLYMKGVVFTNPRDEHYYFDTFFIKDRLIRYIHIPDNMNIIETIKKQLKSMIKQPVKPTKDFRGTLKGKRMRERQLETLKDIEKMQQEKQNRD